MVSGGARAVARCDELSGGRYSAETGMLFRAYLTPAHAAALEATAGWMREAGMTVRLDEAANLIGRYEGAEAGLRILLIGSHIDSVRDGGNYDGPLGIMLGIELVAALAEAGERLPFAIEVIAFGDEEGSRFPASMLCSRAVAGVLDPVALAVVDRDGISVAEARAAFAPSPISGEGRGEGFFVLDRSALPSAALPTASPPEPWGSSAQPSPEMGEGYFAFLETHIEQGPVLESEGLALGVVTGIAAQLRYQARVIGRAGHAGTTAMGLRADALVAAAEMVLAVERIATNDAYDLVATVGRLSVAPGAVNVVPGSVEFSIDVRSGTEAVRDAAARRIAAALGQIADRRGVSLDLEQVQDLAASPCDPILMDRLDASIAAIGQPVRRLVSGAGHDAMVMAQLCPMAMLFIRSPGGISHNPAESVIVGDVELALQAMLGFVRRLGGVDG